MKTFEGIIVASVTPFHEDGRIDWGAFEAYISWLCDQGVYGIVPCGTTGEFPALAADEQKALVKKTVEISAGRACVIAGASSILEKDVISLVNAAESAGANGALVLTPFYIKPSQAGILSFFKSIHEKTQLPLVIYNNPSRSGVNLDVSTFAKLTALSRVVGLKDSSPDLLRPMALSESMREGVSLLCGDDGTFLPALAGGAHGVISVAAGIVPWHYLAMYNAYRSGNMAEALRRAILVQGIAKLLFMAPSPGPAKVALKHMGFCGTHCRLSLGGVPDEIVRNVIAEVDSLGEEQAA